MLLLKFRESSLWEKAKQLFWDQRIILSIWILIALITTIKQYATGNYNNYLIFKYCFWHAVEHLNLYTSYPEYNDTNHYGPFFSLLIAPFAILPDFLGMLFWQLSNTLFLFWAITQLSLTKNQKTTILWLCAHELLTSQLGFQFNPSIAAIIILAYALIERKHDFWAGFFIILGTFIKLYGIVGLAFFFFSKQKKTLILSCIFWSLIFFLLPMLFFSPNYILESYKHWYESLTEKNILNATLSSYQDISIMGMVRRIFQNASIPNLPFIVVGLTLFGLPYLRFKQYRNAAFRMMLLASTLLFTVLFSSSSESPTYIIAFAGVAIWFIIQPVPPKKSHVFLLIFALILTSFSPSDLFPKFVRDQYVKHYALKALPCFLIWITITIEMLKNNFSFYTTLNDQQVTKHD